ncbi:DUF3299 domain-containing protein [Pacificimonas sp. WHA3]|uniref:DUF3299 domain-containing protein n=1 Tax=Pacificimonas pallii TaxID=2827236 RepID=A0ABS6SHS7_9SPHN|nr:DUF3299 domain-containing protein [Pacificimonas pallii]MBV7257598.1 DUF3299 domain-containing protein [Pacificimonas pallii]
MSIAKPLLTAVLLFAAPLGASSAGAIQERAAPAEVEDVWKPAATPRGGVSWATLEATQETQRLEDGIIYAKPVFTKKVKALEGKRIKIAGWMMPLEATSEQSYFVLLGYPPGCPFHFHAAPTQFIEVYANTPFPTDEQKIFIVSGVLELTGQDESGIFYRLRDARPERS